MRDTKQRWRLSASVGATALIGACGGRDTRSRAGRRTGTAPSPWYPAWNAAAALSFSQKVNRTLAQPGAYPNTAKQRLIFDASMAELATGR